MRFDPRFFHHPPPFFDITLDDRPKLFGQPTGQLQTLALRAALHFVSGEHLSDLAVPAHNDVLRTPFGNHIPYQCVTSYPGAVSPIVGTPGKAVERSGVVIARMRTRPALAWGIVGTMLVALSCTSPAMSAFSAGPPPLYGTWTKSTLVLSLKSSSARCTALPGTHRHLDDCRRSLSGRTLLILGPR